MADCTALIEGLLREPRIAVHFSELQDRLPEVASHSKDVARRAIVAASCLQWGLDRVYVLAEAALLHDVGKLEMEPDVLHKPGPLDPDERRRMERHVRAGLAKVRASKEVKYLIGRHHETGEKGVVEKSGGTGYPRRTQRRPVRQNQEDRRQASAALGRLAQILKAADCLSALREARPYKEALSHLEAVEILKRLLGEEVDADILAAVCGEAA